MTEAWLVLRTPPDTAAANMALDELLLEQAGRLGQPLIRFYSWSEPAASFGYFQKYAEVEQWTPLRPLVRRPTGGGLVPHDSDWTYSLALPPDHAWHRLRGGQSYRLLHEWLKAGFRLLGQETRLASAPRNEDRGRCFSGWEQDDLLLGPGKLAGAAQRRNRAGLLVQGSVRPLALAVSRAEWERALLETLERQGKPWTQFAVPSSWREAWQRLAATKYEQDSYLRRK